MALTIYNLDLPKAKYNQKCKTLVSLSITGTNNNVESSILIPDAILILYFSLLEMISLETWNIIAPESKNKFTVLMR